VFNLLSRKFKIDTKSQTLSKVFLAELVFCWHKKLPMTGIDVIYMLQIQEIRTITVLEGKIFSRRSKIIDFTDFQSMNYFVFRSSFFDFIIT
jgi:hypothetical protein